MKKCLLLFICLLVSVCMLQAQNNATPSKKTDKKAAKGTYQFIVTNTRSQVAFSEEILYEIERNRQEKEVKILQLGSQAKVKILSREEINAPGFIPIKEEIIYSD